MQPHLPVLRALGAFLFSAAIVSAAEPSRMGEFKMPTVQEPKIPARTAKVTDFGAVGDGKTLCSAAIAKGIETLAAQGGGRLVFPAGVWLTGEIVLKSNIALHTEEGALIQFTKDYAQFKGRGQIFGDGLENVAITGRGIIDGAGEAWRPVKHYKLPEQQWQALLASGGRLDKQADQWYPRANATNRPRLLIFRNCQRVLLEDTTFQNSPEWCLNPSFCDDVTLRNITVRNPWFSQNGDGLDLESCRNVIIRGARLDVGDDALCMKSGAGAAARQNGRPTENVLIEDCVVYHGHGGFTIGSEMSGGVRNIRVNNCVFMGTDIGLRFKTQRGRGGVVEKIYISNVRMTNIPTDAISFNMYYGGAGPTEEADNGAAEVAAAPVNDGTPQFRDIHLENITVNGARRGIQLQGLPEMPLNGVTLRNVSITADQGLVCQDVANLTLERLELLNGKGPVASFVGAKDIAIDGLTYANGVDTLFRVQGKKNSGIAITRTDAKAAKREVELTGGAEASAITLK